MFNLPVLQVLLQDNANLFTTEGLSSLLIDCIHLRQPERYQFTYPSLLDRQVYLALSGYGGDAVDEEILRRITSDPKGWCLDAPQQVQEGAQFYDRMTKLFGTGFGNDIFVYHNIRDSIQELQQRMGISGVRTRNISGRDRLLSYPTEANQLMIIESDRPTLKTAVPKVVNFFISLVQMPPAYDLFLINNQEEEIPACVSQVESFISKAVMADIYTESNQWEKRSENSWKGKSVDKQDPDSIRLSLHLDYEEEEIVYFEAFHPDKSRFPWMSQDA